VERDLSRRLHKLTGRLDAAADAFLRSEAGISYPRFLALFMVGAGGAATQRSLAERLGVSEPSVSRMVRVLSHDGLLQTGSESGTGNRNRLTLTPAGAALVSRWGAQLETRLSKLVKECGVPYRAYLEQTTRLLEALEAQPVDGAPRSRSEDRGRAKAPPRR